MHTMLNALYTVPLRSITLFLRCTLRLFHQRPQTQEAMVHAALLGGRISQLAKVRNEKIGFIFQGFNLIPDLNLFDNVDVPLRYRGMGAADRKLRIEESLSLVGLGSRMKHFPAELSGGQQQRVAIARALAGSPRLLLADEPTGNLDSQMARSVLELLEDINARGTTIVMVTHDPELAARAHRNVHIVDGMATDLQTLHAAPSPASRATAEA